MPLVVSALVLLLCLLLLLLFSLGRCLFRSPCVLQFNHVSLVSPHLLCIGNERGREGERERSPVCDGKSLVNVKTFEWERPDTHTEERILLVE